MIKRLESSTRVKLGPKKAVYWVRSAPIYIRCTPVAWHLANHHKSSLIILSHLLSVVSGKAGQKESEGLSRQVIGSDQKKKASFNSETSS